MRIPQILIIALYTLSLGICLAKDGEPRDGTYNFGSALIATAIIFAILIWGGFFK
jgi:hypothetical protein